MGQPSPEDETIGQRLRRLRTERGLSQRDLGSPGITYAYISRIEAGSRQPSLKAIRELAKRLGVTPEELETGRPVPGVAERELRVADAELQVRLDGDLEAAEEGFRAVLDDEEAEPGVLARARAGLGLIAMRREDREAGIAQLQEAVDTGHLPPHERPDVYEELAQAYSLTDRPGHAIMHLERALAAVREQAPDDAALEARFMAYLACAYSDAGDAGRATRLLREAEDRVEAVSSPQARVRVYWSLARLAWWDAEDPVTALRYAREALALYRTTEDTRGLALAHVLNASLLNLDREWTKAGRHLDRADKLLVATGASEEDLGILRAEQAKVAAWSGRTEDALRLTQEADRLIADDSLHRGAVQHAYAATHAARGEAAEAEPYFQEALDFLTEHRQWREATMVAREWANLHRSLGDSDKALGLLEHASALALRVRIPREPEPRRSRASEPRRSRA